HEEIPGARAEGEVLLDETDIYGPAVDVVAVRRAVGMVFQKPNPFPTMSVFDNVAAGLRFGGRVRSGRSKAELQAKVESALHDPLGPANRRIRHREVRLAAWGAGSNPRIEIRPAARPRARALQRPPRASPKR